VSALDTILSITTGTATKRARLADYLDAAAEEAAARRANAWIKSLRHARVDGVSFRERFTYGSDSLWWFAELYLHKERAVLDAFRTVEAAGALVARERPTGMRVESGGFVARLVASQVVRRQGVACDSVDPGALRGSGWLAMDARGSALTLGALLSPSRPARLRQQATNATVAAFVHRAFWRGGADAAGTESYIGPTLQALERQLPDRGVQHIGVGPATNFRARRWWARPSGSDARVRPIETLVPRTALAGSLGLWAARHAMRRSLDRSTDLREAAIIGGCDAWPIVRASLAGVALLQFPWSARAIDEATAALDAYRPAVALTYAEAGGWGRALAIAARRRGIPLAGLQHGFIYRHWLNYLHEPDEMAPVRPGADDRGFPLPTRTLVFDEYAAGHLREAGRFPGQAIVVTGSPRLDELAARYARLDGRAVQAARAAAGVRNDDALVLLVTKYAEVRPVLGDLLAAFDRLPHAHLVIKAHPAETTAPYEAATAGRPNVRVLPAAADLAPLLGASRALVTVNSTLALDGIALGVLGLSVGLPNNLSPFVEAGALAGARAGPEIATVLRRLLYDQEFRQQLTAGAAALAGTYRMRPDGQAAARQAAAILGLVQQDAAGRATG
jgi:hypothetical protein